jgi:hypothetical protein
MLLRKVTRITDEIFHTLWAVRDWEEILTPFFSVFRQVKNYLITIVKHKEIFSSGQLVYIQLLHLMKWLS